MNQSDLYIIPLNIATGLLDAWAVYSVSLPLYSVAFIMNTSLAVAIFVFHTLGNPKVGTRVIFTLFL